LSGNIDPKALQVYVGKLAAWPGPDKTPILGSHSRKDRSVFFHPRFPFREGLSYTAFWEKQHAFSFTMATDVPRAELRAIYPSGARVPANLLKIYLHFSEPMGEGRAYEHLKLVHVEGDTVYQPFVPLQPELWSADHRRLTLWLDPGRVKRGLLSHRTHGVVIEPEETYTLIIDPTWKDATGRSLGKEAQKTFRIGAPDYESPKVANWEYEFPDAGTLEPLVIHFKESMDHALAGRLLTVSSPTETDLKGRIILKNEESQWYFYPEAPWAAGEYTIRVDSDLEDLAGNNLNRPFDREISPEALKTVEQDYFLINFRVRASE
jgi:hypothetical protein